MNTRNYILIIILALIALLSRNDIIIPDIMESRNLITAQEMVDDGNWIVPTMNGELRLEKPPLPTWAAAVTMLTLGDSWAAMRLLPALMGVILLLYVYRITLHLTKGNEQQSLLSALILLTCYNFVLMGRTVTWDIYCHTFMLAGIYHLMLMLEEKHGGWCNAVLAGVMTGLSIMSKGPVSPYALLLPFILAWLIARRRDINIKVENTGGKILTVVILALVVGCAWYAYIAVMHTGSGEAVMAKESGSWLNRNVRPPYYYLTFFTETSIWALLCITTLAYPYWRKRLDKRSSYGFMLCWMVMILLVLSLLPEKKNRYLLPVLIPAAMTMGAIMDHWIRRLTAASRRLDKNIFRINAWPLAIAFLAVAGVSIWLGVRGDVSLWLCSIPLAVALLFATVFISMLTLRLDARGIIISVVLAFASIELFGMPVLGHFFCNADYSTPQEILKKQELKDLDIYIPAQDELRIELVYDARHKIKTHDFSKGEPERPYILLITDESKAFSDTQLKTLKTKELGYFDGNRHAKGKRLYRDIFKYKLFIAHE